ncbi:MAG: hypothetical protein R3B41_04080 [Candidatus Doudnabacteria bacterium]
MFNEVAPKKSRWLIWAIVAIVVVGLGLVGYIMVDNSNQDAQISEDLSI